MSKSIRDIYARRGKRGEVERFDFSGAEAKKEIDQYIDTIKATKADLDADKAASAEYADRTEKAASSVEQSASSAAENAAAAISAAKNAKKSADDAAKVKTSVDISAGDATSAVEEFRKIKEEIAASVKTAADSATAAGKSAEAAANSASAASESEQNTKQNETLLDEKVSAAANSASASAKSADDSSASAVTAGESASAAAKSAESASVSEGNASTYAQNAGEYANAASESKKAAADSALTASEAQSAASKSEKNAANSEKAAAESEKNAASSESAAAKSAENAAASADKLVIDDALSDTSTNAIQNKVVNDSITELKEDLGNLYGETISSTIIDFDLGDVVSFIPYRRSSNAGIVYVCNGNLIDPDVTWFNNNGSDFNGANGSLDTNRVRTSTFSIPSECEYLTLSGFDMTTLKLLAVRAFDRDKKSVKNGCFIIPKDDFYNIKVSLNVSNIHLLFGSVSGDIIHPDDVAAMPIMLNIGKTKYDYVKSENKQIGMSIYNYGKDVPVSPSWGLYEHNTIWTYDSGIQFVFKKNNLKKVENNWRTEFRQSKFNKLVSIPDYYSYGSYYELDNITDKFTINTTADEFLTAIDALYKANVAYITRRHFGQTDTSGTYSLYAYELNNVNYSVNNKPSVLLICNQHGYEKNAAFSAYWLIDALCNHYEGNKLLTFLRNEVKILIAPLVNPWGFNQYVGGNIGTEIGYGNSNGVNINRDYENRTSKEAQFVMSVTERVHNAIIALDVHSNGTTRTSKDYSQLNWHSYENNSALFLVDTSDKFLSLASQSISKELKISDTAMGIISIDEKSSNGQTLTYAWSNLAMTNLCFELPLKLPTETEEATVLCQKIGTELLVNYLGMVVQKYKELIN